MKQLLANSLSILLNRQVLIEITTFGSELITRVFSAFFLRPTSIFLITLLSFITSCSSGSKSNELSFKEKVKLRQYMVQGKILYSTHCANCHQKDGSGLRQLIPALTDNAFITENRENLACIAKNGMAGKLEINGISFDDIMPPNPRISNLELAEILTYIGNNWGLEFGIITIEEVEGTLKKCSK